MASLLFKEMKGVNYSCASPASAAVCTSIERRSMVQPCTGRALDRHSPHLRDPRREKSIINSMSQAPSKSKSYNQKNRKNSDKQVELISPAASSRYLLDDAPFFDVFPDLEEEEEEEEEEPVPPLLAVEQARLQASKGDESRLPSSKRDDSAALKPDGSTFVRPSSLKGDDSAVLKPSSSKGDDFIVFSPSSLEGDDSAASGSSGFSGDKSAVLCRPPTRPQDQVVVLRVSLHCKGCEGKVRKHISKMAGVTSFNIDFATKKVTVIGDVTPLGVLNSISKVKNAQFWPSQPGSSAPT